MSFGLLWYGIYGRQGIRQYSKTASSMKPGDRDVGSSTCASLIGIGSRVYKLKVADMAGLICIYFG